MCKCKWHASLATASLRSRTLSTIQHRMSTCALVFNGRALADGQCSWLVLQALNCWEQWPDGTARMHAWRRVAYTDVLITPFTAHACTFQWTAAWPRYLYAGCGQRVDPCHVACRTALRNVATTEQSDECHPHPRRYPPCWRVCVHVCHVPIALHVHTHPAVRISTWF